MSIKKKKTTNYQVTIGYKAVITFDVEAKDEFEARELAMEEFKEKSFGDGSTIQDDNFAVHGILNLDKTYKMLDKD